MMIHLVMFAVGFMAAVVISTLASRHGYIPYEVDGCYRYLTTRQPLR